MTKLPALCLAILLLLAGQIASAQKRMTIVGSSTSACYGVSTVDSCYVSRLSAYYNKQAPNDTVISNEFAVGGYTVFQGMPSWYVSPYATPVLQPEPGHNITAALATHPDVVLINYPTNGYDYLTVSEILFCLRTIKNEANLAGVPCYITTTQPRTSGTYNTPAVKAKLAALKDSIVAQFGNYAIDFYTDLINPADSSIRYDAGDGIHMNNTGHDSLFQKVLRKNVFGIPPVPVPACVTNTAPVNGATIATQTTATLSWPAAADAASYDVYIWTGAVIPSSPTTNTTSTSYNATGLLASTQYNWFVAPRNISGVAACAATNTTSFITATPPLPIPACITNTAPVNGVTIATQTTATLSWPAALNASSYDVYIWTGAVPPSTPTTNTTLVSYTATGLLASTQYNWFVAPRNVSGVAACAATNTTSFITATPPLPVPACVTNTAPVNAVIIATQTTATLIWPAALNATSYDVYIWTGAVAPSTPTTNTTLFLYSATGLQASTQYNWYVAPRNASGVAACAATNTTTFTTATPLIPVPACVTNTAPANAAIIATQTTATLSWPAAANASSYDVYIWTGAVAPSSPTTNTTITSYSATGLLASTQYNWYVAPRNISGAAACAATNTTTFTTATPPLPIPACVSNTAPANGTTIATQTTATLVWPAAANATSYDLYIWTGPVPPSLPTAITTTTSYSATSLLASTQYNWFVNPKNASGVANCGGTSITYFITATTPPLPVPGCVSNTAPANGATIATQTTATLSWPAAANATSYDVYIWTGAVVPSSPTTNTTTTSYSATSLLASTQYKWFIAPRNVSGAASCAATNTTSFITATPVVPVPACVSNTAPANGAIIATQTTATLNWPAAANATSYDVYIWTGAVAPSSPTTNTTTTSYSAASLLASTQYSWFVAPRNTSGAASCSATNTTTFITATPVVPVPACVSNTAPANGATIATQTTATLSWPAAANATSYDVYIWTGTVAPSSPTTNTTSTSYSATSLLASTQYKWFIAPRNISGAASCAATNTTTFITATPAVPVPACVSNIAPANGASIATQTTATLNWSAAANATSYDVYIWTGATAPDLPTTNTSTNSYNVSGLLPSTQYNWYVAPKNASGTATGCGSSNKSTFTTATAAVVSNGTGLLGVYYNGIGLSGTPLLTRVDPVINFALTYSGVLSPAPGIVPQDNFSVRWTGQIKPMYSETYTFYTLSDDGIRLWVNGVLLVDNWINQGATEKSGTITLVAGQKYDIVIEYFENAGEAFTKLSWSSSSTPKSLVPQSQLFPADIVSPIGLPACVNNIYPVNASAVSTPAVALLWNTTSTAVSYDVYVWTSGSAAPSVPTASTTGNSFYLNNLTPATTYNWYVVPKNAAGSAAGCAAGNKTSFTTDDLASSGTGLQGVYYRGTDLSGTPLLVRIDPEINFAFTVASGNVSPAPGIVPEDLYSVRWTGQVKPLYSETYTFYTIADDGIRLWINGVLLIDNWVVQAATEKSATISLLAGQKYDIKIEYYEHGVDAITKLYWSSPSTVKAIVPQSQLYPTTGTGALIANALAQRFSNALAANSSSAALTVTAAVHPNPVKQGQFAKLLINSNRQGTAVINIISSTGNVIDTKKINLVAGMNTATLNTVIYKPGFYIVSVNGVEKWVNMKLVIE